MRKNAGQVVVLILLLSLMGLTVGLSQVSRSLSDLKQVTYVDAGTKAFAAAEAALQYGLNQVPTYQTTGCLGPTTPIPLSPSTNFGGAINTLTYNICSNSGATAYFPGVLSDEAREIDLSKIGVGTTGVDVAWSNPSAGMEVIVVDNNFAITRYVYNAYGTSPATGFSSASQVSVGSGCTQVITSGSCTSPDTSGASSLPVSSTYKLLRVKPLGGTANIVVVGRGTSPDLGPTTYTVTAVATTVNNTTKKLQVIKTPPALPGVFDFAIFSRGGVTKN